MGVELPRICQYHLAVHSSGGRGVKELGVERVLVGARPAAWRVFTPGRPLQLVEILHVCDPWT